MGTCWTGDEILFGVRGSTLFTVTESGGEPVAITSLDTGAREGGHGWPSAVPGTPIVLFSILSEGGSGAGVDISLAAVDRSTGAVTRFDLDGSRPQAVAVTRTSGRIGLGKPTEPLWSPDGREIFYLANDRVALFETGSYFFGGQGRNYDIDPAGQRFVMVKNVVDGPPRPMPITIVLNWGEELRARIK